MKTYDPQISAEQHLDEATRLYHETEEVERALDECDAAIDLAASFLAEAYNLRGAILEELDRAEEAFEAYDTALAIKPGFAAAADNLQALRADLDIGDLVTVARFVYPVRAHVARERLAAEGVWAFVANEGTVGSNWLFSNLVGGVQLQVRGQDAERARCILDEIPEDAEVMEADDAEEILTEEELVCPSCGSSDVCYEAFEKRGVFASWLALGFPLPFLKRKVVCRDCGHQWQDSVDISSKRA